LEVREASLFERPTVLEEGERGLENWIRVFRQTLIEKMGEANGQQWIQEVERQCRAELFTRWELGAGLPEIARCGVESVNGEKS